MPNVESLTRRLMWRGAVATAAVAAGVAAEPAAVARPGPDVAAKVAAYDRAEAVLEAATGDAAIEAAADVWSAAVRGVADEQPLSVADLRAAADVLRRVRAIERGPRDHSAEHDALLEALLADLAGGLA